jgi:hypothetical protein
VVEVPEVVRNKAIVAGASAWLGALPAIVADLEADWSLRVGRAFETAAEAFVAERAATTACLSAIGTPEAGSGFKPVDPDGLVAEPEYDLGIIMRQDPAGLVEDDPRERSRGPDCQEGRRSRRQRRRLAAAIPTPRALN